MTAAPGQLDLYAPLDWPGTPAPAPIDRARRIGAEESRRIARIRRMRLGNQHAADIERLKPHVLELAQRARRDGITNGDIRLMAERRGLIGRGSGRSLSWLAALPKACGLIDTGRRRMSPLSRSRNDHHVFVAAEFAA